MDDKKIKELFDKHFNNLGKYFYNKIVKNESKLLDSFSHVPLSIKDTIIGTIFNTSSIRYGKFIEDVINEFLIENNAIINQDDKEKGNYDLLFQLENKLYVGEIKMRDNHDSTKKSGQKNNLIQKIIKQKKKNSNLKVIGIFYFIDSNERKNGKYYLNELRKYVEANQFDDAKIFYGDEIFEELNILNEWNLVKQKISNFNLIQQKENYICKIIENYLKEKLDDDKCKKMLKIIKEEQ